MLNDLSISPRPDNMYYSPMMLIISNRGANERIPLCPTKNHSLLVLFTIAQYIAMFSTLFIMSYIANV